MTRLSTEITETERGRLRLWQLDTDVAQARELAQALTDRREEAGRLAQAALGTPQVQADWLFAVRRPDLGALGLDGYLAQGHEVPPDEIAQARAALDGARGTLLVADTRAFPDRPVTLQPARFLSPVAEVQTDVSLPPARSRAPSSAAAPDAGQTRFGEGQADGASSPPRGYLIPGLVLAALLILALVVFSGSS